MSDAFEAWIRSMSDDEYSDMLDDSNPNGFTDNQEEKALNIREAPPIEEQSDLTRLQEFEEPLEVEAPTEEQVQEQPKRKGSIFSREREPVTINEGTTFIEQPVGEPIKISKVGERVTMTREPVPRIPPQSTPSIISGSVTPPSTPRVIPPSKPAVRSFRTSITNAVASAGRFVRRFFRV